MTTLAIITASGGDNKPPMLEKHLYDSWKSRMELYMMNRPHGIMILASVEKGPLVWPSITEFVTPYQTQQFTTNQSTPLSITYPTNEYQSTVHHNVYSPQPSIPQLEYAPTAYQQQQPEFSQPDSSLVVPVFQKGDDPIDAINHMMSFLTAVVHIPEISYYQQSAKDFGRQTTYAAGTTRKYTPGASGSNTGKQRTVICYNCKGEGHIAKQYTKPSRKGNETWFNDKVLLSSRSSMSADDLGDAYDSESDELNTAKMHHMANLSRNGSDALTEETVQNPNSFAPTRCPDIIYV
ncbi:ribosome biogenesis protein BMS1 [Tanacetum coccineum]